MTVTLQSPYLFICKGVRKITCITQGTWLEAQTRVCIPRKKKCRQGKFSLQIPFTSPADQIFNMGIYLKKIMHAPVSSSLTNSLTIPSFLTISPTSNTVWLNPQAIISFTDDVWTSSVNSRNHIDIINCVHLFNDKNSILAPLVMAVCNSMPCR